MKVKLNKTQREALAKVLLLGGSGVAFDINFQHAVGDGSGKSTQIQVDSRWLHRDGTWHDEPELPTPRWLVGCGKFFVKYTHDRIDWTQDPAEAEWFHTLETAQEFIDTDERLQGHQCYVWEQVT